MIYKIIKYHILDTLNITSCYSPLILPPSNEEMLAISLYLL